MPGLSRSRRRTDLKGLHGLLSAQGIAHVPRTGARPGLRPGLSLVKPGDLGATWRPHVEVCVFFL